MADTDRNRVPDTLIKIIWVVHFALTSWAIMSPQYLAGVPSYLFTQMGVLAFGFWTMVSAENASAALMFMVTLSLSVVNDILLISIYQPRAEDNIERTTLSGYRDEYRWSLGMSIINLIVKPVSIFLVYAVYRSRSDQTEFNLDIPGLTNRSQYPSSRTGQGQYTTIESAQDSHPGVYGRQSYPYQSIPPEPQPHQTKANRPNEPPQA